MIAEAVLIRLGYRRMSTYWTKPIGFHVLVVDLNKREICRFYRPANGAPGTVATWDRQDLKDRDQDPWLGIPDFEAYTGSYSSGYPGPLEALLLDKFKAEVETL